MRRGVERVVFGAVALGLHLGALSAVQMQPAGAQGGAGDGGDAMISLAAVDGTVAEMVAAWDRPPEVATPPAPAMPPPVVEAAPLATTPQTALSDVTAPQMPSLPQMPVPETDAPALPTVVMEAPPPSEPVIEPEPEPTFAPVVTARPLERPDRPEPTPEPVRQAEAPPERQSEPQPQMQSQQAQPGQRAAGQGGGAVAGNAGTSEAASVSPAARSSLMADWGGTIRSRIERRKSYPRAAGGATGTVQVAIRIGGDGRLVGLGLAGSSGNAALDQAALDAVQRAGSFPAAPADLGAGPHDFTLPMSFGG